MEAPRLFALWNTAIIASLITVAAKPVTDIGDVSAQWTYSDPISRLSSIQGDPQGPTIQSLAALTAGLISPTPNNIGCLPNVRISYESTSWWRKTTTHIYACLSVCMDSTQCSMTSGVLFSDDKTYITVNCSTPLINDDNGDLKRIVNNVPLCTNVPNIYSDRFREQQLWYKYKSNTSLQGAKGTDVAVSR